MKVYNGWQDYQVALNQRRALERQRNTLQMRIRTAPPAARPVMMTQLKALNLKIRALPTINTPVSFNIMQSAPFSNTSRYASSSWVRPLLRYSNNTVTLRLGNNSYSYPLGVSGLRSMMTSASIGRYYNRHLKRTST